MKCEKPVPGAHARRVACVVRPRAKGIVDMSEAFIRYINSQQAKYDSRSIWDAAIAHQKEVDAELIGHFADGADDNHVITIVELQDAIRKGE